MSNIKELLLIACLAFAVRVPWLIMVPQVEAPDENTHRWVINFVAKNLSLPDSQTIKRSGPIAVYGSLPQFGYLPHIVLLRLIPDVFSPSLVDKLVRLASILMGVLVVIAAYFVGQILFLPDRLTAIALPLLIVFHPQFVFVSSYANNDSATAALCALSLLLLILCLRDGLNSRKVILLTVLFSLLVLSKYSGYCVLLSALIFSPIILWLHRTRLKSQLIFFLALFFSVFILTSWWFVRNYYQFAGDITGTQTMNNIWVLTYHHRLEVFRTPWPIIFSSYFWRVLFFSFWGWFGYLTRSLPRIIYYVYLAFILFAAWRACTMIGRKKPTADTLNNPVIAVTSPGQSLAQGSLRAWTWLLFTICFVSNLAICVIGCCSGIAGPQGRYLFASEIPIMAMLIAGLAAKQNRRSKILIISLLVFNLLSYCYSTFSVCR